MRVARWFVTNFEEIAAGAFLVLMSLATFGNVILRYALNSPLQWAEEFSRYAFIWVVFLGAAACSKRKTHIAIDVLALLAPEPLRRLLALSVQAVVLVLTAAVTYYGWVLCRLATQATSTLNIPQYVVYLVVPFSAALIFMHTALDVYRDVRALAAPRAA
jgi:TRAP-type C4-dicarboxylate transport system permease small subunit